MASNSKSALITGITGQDGSLLAKKLVDEGFEVTGTFRRGSGDNLWRLKEMGILNSENIRLHEHEIGSNSTSFFKLLSNNFDYIFHLAGDSFTQDSFLHPSKTINTNVNGYLELLETLVAVSPSSKVFVACSSEIYGHQPAGELVVNEESQKKPVNPYGVSHSMILYLSDMFRTVHSQFISVGILFNHESEYRGEQFLTRKISKGLAFIKSGFNKPIEVGNLDASRDWGSAAEFTGVFKDILDHSSPEDFVIATGRPIKVRDIVTAGALSLGFQPEFQGIGMNENCVDRKSGKILLTVSGKYMRKVESPNLIGNTQKIRNHIKWTAQVPIESVIQKMCEADLNRIGFGQK
jgi:GDPmannose 4,6-dehydratase